MGGRGRGCRRGGRRGRGCGRGRGHALSSQSSHASKFEVKGGVPRIIRVSGAGDNIINGTYQLLATTRHVAKLPLPAGLVYVRDDGPLNCRSGGNRLNDVCIFCRDRYGHRAWWCIGLVPHHRRRCPAAEGGVSDSMDLTMWTMTSNGDDDDAIVEEGFKTELHHGILYY